MSPTLWLAHALTLARLPLAAAVVAASGHAGWIAAAIALAAATDAADGAAARWARRRGATGPDIGGWLDPLVDKLFVAAVLGAIWARTGDPLAIGLIAARELVLVPLLVGYVATGRPLAALAAAPLGKAATVAQLVACAVAIAAPAWARPVAAVAAVLGLGAVIGYVRRFSARGRLGGGQGLANTARP